MKHTKNEEEKKENKKQLIRRWDDIRRNQMSYVQNTLLVISLAFLGYLISFLKENKDCFLVILIFAIYLLIILNIVSALIRLLDYRDTAQKVRKNRDLNRFDGSTWTLFYIQIIFFIFILSMFIFYILTKQN